MIDLNHLRTNPELYEDACLKKGVKFSISEFLDLDREYRSTKQKTEEMRSLQNSVSKEMPKLSGAAKEAKLAEMKELSSQLKDLSSSFGEIETKWSRLQLQIPAIPLAEVPYGKTDADNVERRTWGTLPQYDFEIRDHVALGDLLDIIDIPRGVKVAGARNYFLKGAGAMLQHAILSLAMEVLEQENYTIMDCPHLVLKESMEGTGYFPGGEEMAFHLDERDDNHYLIGTSEVSVCSYHKDEILDLEELPLRYAGYSPCYRREAGAYGRDTHGLYRVHQFYKVEQVVICKACPKESAKLHQELLGNAEKVLQLLEMPYRVVDVCTGDMGQGQVYKNDIEVWMPSRQAYGETHSCSTFYDFQARRLKLRYKDEDGNNVLCHTLNNTCVASPRILIPLLELNQNEDGSINIPKALQKFMGGKTVIKPKQ